VVRPRREARLVLWDIDGTLVDSAGAGREAFSDAFRALFGRAPEGQVAMNGRTDLEIALEVLELNGIAEGETHLDGFASALAEALAAKAELIAERGRPYPGAMEAIERLAAEPGVVQSLLTGNIEQNAALKLYAVGLGEHLDLEVGGYGSDHRVRSELVAIARRKALRKYSLPFGAEDTVLIGDTPLDVAAARTAGARSVAIASHAHAVGELAAAGADAVLGDLRDAEALVAAVLGASRGHAVRRRVA
jgi:phosphoglycolate phosphatase-like HAD superfamily hydrolase